MADIDVSGWSKRNMWPMPNGELAVRPGLHLESDLSGSGSTVAAWAVRNQFTGDLWYYVVSHNDNGPTSYVTVYDETWAEVGTPTSFAVTRNGGHPTACGLAVVHDQVVVTIGNTTPLWGYVGSSLIEAVKVENETPDLTPALDVPRGQLCVEWQSRCVMSIDHTLYISDPVGILGGSPKTFIGANQVSRPGRIFGLHVNGVGDLVVCSTDGVWSLTADAAASGASILGEFVRLSDHATLDYQKTCLARGRIYGLTERGIRLIDEPGGREWILDEPTVPTVSEARIGHINYRGDGIAVPSPRGPCVALDDEAALWRLDVDNGMASWWTASSLGLRARAVVSNGYGDEVVVTTNDAYRVDGNHESDAIATVDGYTVTGGYVGAQPLPPQAAAVVRRVDVSSDGGGLVRATIKGTQKTGTPPQSGLIIGTDTWESASSPQPSLSSKRLHFHERVDEVAGEILADRPLTRLAPQVSIDFRGAGRKRPA